VRMVGGCEQTEVSRRPNARTTRADWSSSCLSYFPETATVGISARAQLARLQLEAGSPDSPPNQGSRLASVRI
jgi:hypothetical protein